tara:strand:- start:512 stop:2449 length:1938 start_codon:yes stop_codon:yes gene_type:complete
MSDLRVTRLRGRTLGSSPSLPDGAVVTGVTTSGSLKISDTTESTSSATGAVIISGGVGIAKSLHVGGNVSVGGTLTYEDVTNQDVLGIATFRSGVKFGINGVGGTITAAGHAAFENGLNVSGVATAGNGIHITGNLGLGGADYGTAGQLLTSGGPGANASWTTVSSNPEFAGIASGSITGGKGVCVADDGKLLPVTGDNELYGTSTQFGDVTNDFSIVYDPNNDKYVYFFRDVNYGDYGNVMVGTPNGATITWGTKQLFDTTSVNPSQINAFYDSVNQKILVSYRDNSDNNCGTVIVCSLSGTTLTIGTPVRNASNQNHIEYSSFVFCPTTSQGAYYALIYNDGSTNKGRCRIGKYSGTNSTTWSTKVIFLDAQARGTGGFYDTTADKLCLMSHVSTDSNTSYIWAGTIASDEITFGTGQKYGWDNVDGYRLTGAHDPNTGTNVLSYGKSSFKGNCRTATLSGTTFTFGTEFQFSAANCYQTVMAYGSSPNKFLISYVDGADSDYVKTVIATLSGTTITYATPRVFQEAGGASSSMAWILYNATAKNFLALYLSNEDGTNKAAYYIEAIRVSNLTKGNYVGIANASVTNGQTASTALPGAVNTAVSGLTVGQKYYVIADGTLNTTADSEAIDAGNAIAVNKLLVR